ncbi:DUF1471 domain-containing protein [Enterobacter asburiae]|nr:DUF1471 domain-containing protein [Enterobacter asburiae]
MKKTIVLCLFSLFSWTSLSSQAQTISAVAPTIDSAEARIARQAEDAGKSYKIIGTHNNNFVYMIARLVSDN